jgi:hypothetical protein
MNTLVGIFDPSEVKNICQGAILITLLPQLDDFIFLAFQQIRTVTCLILRR